MSDEIEIGKGWTFDAETQADIDAGRCHKVASVNVDAMTWQDCCNCAKQQFELMQYKADNALIGAVNRWCDIMLMEPHESLSKLTLAEFIACLNIAQQSASEDQRSIKIGHPPRKIVALLLSMSQVINNVRVDRPISVDEVREQARINGLPNLPNDVIALSEEAEEKLAGKPSRCCRVQMVDGGIRIDQTTIALKPKQVSLMQLLVDAKGEFISLEDHGYRSRDIEAIPEGIQEVIDAQSGKGTRILPKWLN